MALLLVALALSPLATAGNGTSEAGYGGESAVQVALVESAQASSAGSLPVTGTDLGLAVAGGVVLLLVGFGMRRLGRQRQ
ncbi:MAG TPA: hypothetical protein VNK94_05800 [Gaiellaceae bacterium]|nr:hypothetical protein [Gaiellaceae bacterium]